MVKPNMSGCQVRRCCCFDNTKDSSIACGVYTLILAVIGIIANSLLLVKIEYIPDAGVYSSMFLAALVIYSLQFLVSIILIYGVVANKRMCLIPWMVWIIIEIAMHGYGIIAGIKQLNTVVIIATLALGTLLLCLDIYCFISVRSHYYVLSLKDALNSADLAIYSRF